MIIKTHSLSPTDTFHIGEKIGQQLKGNEIILLEGELGAGKTLFTKGIAKALGIDPDEVVSPSFTIANRYKGKNNTPVHHIDLYRLGSSSAGYLPEIDDFIDEAVIIVEWAQYLNASYFQLKNSVSVEFHLTPGNENARLLTLETSLDSFRL